MSKEIMWRKSTASQPGGNCVEVGSTADNVLVRDTTDREGFCIKCSYPAWQTFTRNLNNN